MKTFKIDSPSNGQFIAASRGKAHQFLWCAGASANRRIELVFSGRCNSVAVRREAETTFFRLHLFHQKKQ